MKKYRKLFVKKMADGRYDVFETKEDIKDDYPIADNFQTQSMAMEWIDLEYYAVA